MPLAKFAGPPPWKISNIRSSRIVLSSRSVYLMEMITLRQLRYLSALAKHGHFGRAAEACAVTQPALSMQIRDLERTLGVAVVERRPGDVMLTDVGREIARRAKTCSRPRAIWSISPAIAAACCTGRLTLGVIPSLAPYLLPRILPLLQTQVSGIAAGISGNPDQATDRGHQERRARCGDARVAGGRARHRFALPCSRICFCWRCPRAIRARRPRGLPRRISIKAG